MCKILSITNRRLCKGDFLTRIAQIAAQKPAGIILREKDLPQQDYAALAAQVQEICKKADVPCILHSFPETAKRLRADALHLPLPLLRELKSREGLPPLGVSCHSVQDAQEAAQAGASYLIAGHIFETDCKKGLAGRGLQFLHEVCESVSVPVFAIGGISPDNAAQVMQQGAAGICVMSGLMQCDDPADCMKQLKGGMCRAI